MSPFCSNSDRCNDDTVVWNLGSLRTYHGVIGKICSFWPIWWFCRSVPWYLQVLYCISWHRSTNCNSSTFHFVLISISNTAVDIVLTLNWFLVWIVMLIAQYYYNILICGVLYVLNKTSFNYAYEQNTIWHFSLCFGKFKKLFFKIQQNFCNGWKIHYNYFIEN